MLCIQLLTDINMYPQLCTGIYSCRYTLACANMQVYTWIFRYIQLLTHISLDAQLYVLLDIDMYTGLYEYMYNVLVNTPVYTHLHILIVNILCTHMYRLQDLTRFQDFMGSLHQAFTSPSQVELMAIKKS